MKTASTFLFDLLNTLTKSEKRYIKVQAGSSETTGEKGEEKDYIQLMDALLAQKEFDEDQLVKDNKEAKFVKNLAVNKRYLYDVVLNGLTNFGQKSLEDKIYEKIAAANVLIEKGMFKAAFRELKKGQKVAEKYELYELQIMLLAIEKRLVAQRQFKTKNDNVIHQIFDSEEHCLKELKNSNEYWYLAQQIAQFQIRFQNIQGEEQKQYIDGLTKSPKFQNKSLATNFKSTIYYYRANSIYQFMLGNVEKAYEINKDFLDLLEANPHFLLLYSDRYLATLNNMLIDSLVIGKYDILEEGINRLVKIPQRKEFQSIKNIESRVFRQRYILLINWCLSQNDFEKALQWIPEIETGLKQFGKKIEKHHRITFYYLNAYISFQNAQYDQALRWNNEILNDPRENVVKEIFYFARSLNLLIHFELGNHDLLESLLLSTPQYLKARRSVYATEKALFRFLGKSINLFNRKAKRKLIDNFKISLNDLFEKPKERRVFNYLDLRIWAEQILEKS